MSLNQLKNGTFLKQSGMCGLATTVGLTATVANTQVNADSIVLVSFHSGGDAVPADATALRVTNIVDDTSFDIEYNGTAANVKVSWLLLN